jgi:alkanesulfonate monooxygenase SsuD/methylene tetrahydromethanopterin reductase-like flavin-dependent oxidoreductase (luciferase family)
MATERLEFVSSVYVLPLRHPLVVAAAVATAAVLSGNRVAVGAGLGWLDDEYVQLGQEWAHRGSRMAEQIELMRRLWSGECVEFHGRFYDVAGTLHQPPLDPLPPILLGATKTPGYRRTARIADGFIGGRLAFDEFLAAKAEIERHREEFGRTNEPFIWINALRHEEAVQPDALRRFAEAGCNSVRVSPFDIDGLAPGHETSLQERLDSLERYAERYLPAAQER